MHMTRGFRLSPMERLDAGLALTTQEVAELFGQSRPSARTTVARRLRLLGAVPIDGGSGRAPHRWRALDVRQLLQGGDHG
jgi:hypothetical protein